VGFHDICTTGKKGTEVWKFWADVKAQCKDTEELRHDRKGKRPVGIGVVWL